MGQGETTTRVTQLPLSPEEIKTVQRQNELLDLQIADYKRESDALAEMFPETKQLMQETQAASLAKIQSDRAQISMVNRARGIQEEAYRSAAGMLGIQSAQTADIPSFEEWVSRSGGDVPEASLVTQAATPGTEASAGTPGTPGDPGRSDLAHSPSYQAWLETVPDPYRSRIKSGEMDPTATLALREMGNSGPHQISQEEQDQFWSQFQKTEGTPGTPATPKSEGTPEVRVDNPKYQELRGAYDAYVASRKAENAATQQQDTAPAAVPAGWRGQGTFGSPAVPPVTQLQSGRAAAPLPPAAQRQPIPFFQPGAQAPAKRQMPPAIAALLALATDGTQNGTLPENDPLGLRRLISP